MAETRCEEKVRVRGLHAHTAPSKVAVTGRQFKQRQGPGSHRVRGHKHQQNTNRVANAEVGVDKK